MKILKSRISKIVDENQHPEQTAYRKGYSLVDYLHTVTRILEKTNEYRIPMYTAFVDYEKAFNFIKHGAVFSALEKHVVPSKYINIIKETYKGGTAQT